MPTYKVQVDGFRLVPAALVILVEADSEADAGIKALSDARGVDDEDWMLDFSALQSICWVGSDAPTPTILNEYPAEEPE